MSNNNINVEFPPLLYHQHEVLSDIINYGYNSKRRYVIKSMRQVGKTFLLFLSATHAALSNKNFDIYLMSTSAYSSNKAFNEYIVQFIKDNSHLSEIRAMDKSIRFPNGSAIYFVYAGQDENLLGNTGELVIIDEARKMNSEFINRVVRQFVKRTKGTILTVSTPLKKSGYFYEEIKKGLDPTLTNYTYYNWSDPKYDKSTLILYSKEDRELDRLEMPHHIYKTEVLGEFLEDGEGVFPNYENCIYYQELSNTQPIALGIDWAPGTGNDDTVLTSINSEGQVTYIWHTNDMNPLSQCNFIADYINSKPTIKLVYLEQNITHTEFEYIKSKLKRPNILVKYLTTNQSKRDFISLLGIAFQQQTIQIPNDDQPNGLLEQLINMDIEETKTSYTFNARRGFHDDKVISLCLAWKAYYDLGNKVSLGNIKPYMPSYLRSSEKSNNPFKR